MHILDVISSRSSKCIKIVGVWSFVPYSTGELTALPRPLSWVKEGILLRPLFRGGGKEEMGGGEWSGGRQNDLRPRVTDFAGICAVYLYPIIQYNHVHAIKFIH